MPIDVGNDPFLSHSGQNKKKDTFVRPKTSKPQTKQAQVHAWAGNKKDVGRDVAQGCSLVFVPLLEFILVFSLFLFGHWRVPLLTWLTVMCCFTVSAVMITVSLLGQSRETGFHFALGVSCIVACVLAVCMGSFAYHAYMEQYWWMETGRHYANLNATSPAGSHLDGSLLHFHDTSAVDTTKAVGFRDGTVYCVAPVLDDTQSKRVEYWAVGKDCCDQRGDFLCDDASDPTASNAVVILGGTMLLPGQEQTRNKHWIRAVREAEAAHDLASSEGAMLVRWVRDPVTIQDQLHSSGVMLLGVGAALELVVAVILMCVLPRPSRKPLAAAGQSGVHYQTTFNP